MTGLLCIAHEGSSTRGRVRGEPQKTLQKQNIGWPPVTLSLFISQVIMLIGFCDSILIKQLSNVFPNIFILCNTIVQHGRLFYYLMTNIFLKRVLQPTVFLQYIYYFINVFIRGKLFLIWKYFQERLITNDCLFSLVHYYTEDILMHLVDKFASQRG